MLDEHFKALTREMLKAGHSKSRVSKGGETVKSENFLEGREGLKPSIKGSVGAGLANLKVKSHKYSYKGCKEKSHTLSSDMSRKYFLKR